MAMRPYFYLLTLFFTIIGTRASFRTETLGGAVSAPPQLTVIPSADTIDFGYVTVGACRDTLLLLLNSGDDILSGDIFPPKGEDSSAFRGGAAGFALDTMETFDTLLSFCPEREGRQTASLSISSNGGNRTIVLVGTGISIEDVFDRDTIDFGLVTAPEPGDPTSGSMARPMFNLFNPSDQPIIATVAILGPAPEFALLQPTRPESIIGREFLQMVLEYAPGDVGLDSAVLEIFADKLGRDTIFLRGTGVRTIPPGDTLKADTGSIDFGAAYVDTCVERSFLLTNNGTSAALLDRSFFTTRGTPYPNAPFAIAFPKLPYNLPPDSSIDVIVRFCPTDTGLYEADLELRDTSTLRSDRVRLSGRGLMARLSYPLSLSFDVVLPDAPCDTQTVTVRNIGNAPAIMTIPSIAGGAPGFTISLTSGSFPDTLDPDDSLVFTMIYCDTALGASQVSATFDYYVPVKRLPGAIVLNTSVRRPAAERYTIDRDTVDYFQVPVNGCRRDSFAIANMGNVEIELDTMWIDRIGGTAGNLIVVRPINIPVLIPPRARLQIVYDYCPGAPGIDRFRWTGMIGGALTKGVILQGEGIDTLARRHLRFFWREAVTNASVGEKIGLRIHADDAGQGGGPGVGVNWRKIVIGYNPRSFFIERVVPGPGSTSQLQLLRGEDSTVTVTRLDTAPVQSREEQLFALEMIGLSTGTYDNVMKLVSVDIGLPDTVVAKGDAVVLLSGCDVDRGISVGRKVALRSIYSESGSRDITLVYSAPRGTVPLASIIGASGERVWSGELPDATGEEQRAPVDLTGLAPGFYLLELRIGSDRSAAPIMIGW